MTRALSALTALLLALCLSTASAATRLDKRVLAATEVLQELTRIPEQGIPPNLLSNAYAVAVLPNVIKAGFIIGGRYGEGLLVVRRPDGSWSNPSFVKLGGGSVGFQAGAQGSDVVLVFKTRRGVENIAKGKFTLGGDMAVAAGPIGRYTSASTDLGFTAEIYSYSRNRGLFGGVSLDGSVLGMDHKANYAYYETTDGSAHSILSDKNIPAPSGARRFKEVLSAAAPSMNWQGERSQQAAIRQEPARVEESEAPEPTTRTYGLDDAPAAEGEAIF